MAHGLSCSHGTYLTKPHKFLPRGKMSRNRSNEVYQVGEVHHKNLSVKREYQRSEIERSRMTKITFQNLYQNKKRKWLAPRGTKQNSNVMRCPDKKDDLRRGQNIDTWFFKRTWAELVSHIILHGLESSIVAPVFRCRFSWESHIVLDGLAQSHRCDDHSETTYMNANCEGTSYLYFLGMPGLQNIFFFYASKW